MVSSVDLISIVTVVLIVVSGIGSLCVCIAIHVIVGRGLGPLLCFL